MKPFFSVCLFLAFFFFISAVFGVSQENNDCSGAAAIAPRSPERTVVPLIPPAYGAPQAPKKTINAVRIKIVPQIPDPNSKKTYRAQLGAFSNTELAWRCFDLLQSAGLNPAFELHGSMYRVVIPGLPAAYISELARRLETVAFTEVWIREE